MERDKESKAIYYVIGWLGATYASSESSPEKSNIAMMFRDIKKYFEIDSSTLNSIIEKHYGQHHI